jgi:hypothetical protein
MCSLNKLSLQNITTLPVESPNVKLTPRPFCFLTSSATEGVMAKQSLMALCTSRDAQDV